MRNASYHDNRFHEIITNDVAMTWVSYFCFLSHHSCTSLFTYTTASPSIEETVQSPATEPLAGEEVRLYKQWMLAAKTTNQTVLLLRLNLDLIQQRRICGFFLFDKHDVYYSEPTKKIKNSAFVNLRKFSFATYIAPLFTYCYYSTNIL
jgi:hypothetical protein